MFGMITIGIVLLGVRMRFWLPPADTFKVPTAFNKVDVKEPVGVAVLTVKVRLAEVAPVPPKALTEPTMFERDAVTGVGKEKLCSVKRSRKAGDETLDTSEEDPKPIATPPVELDHSPTSTIPLHTALFPKIYPMAE